MQEPVGNCCLCGRIVYCMDGFLNGVYIDNDLYCFPCRKEQPLL
ncbi:hypothetical protein ATL39_0410 [Sinobaca qinghaiensis]|uniref:Inhibitor of sigma-G Gin protein n=1 Tax=Sinobaca qinghaiensis TaxID=342944 RepID=A0A419V815_9BACL|nr:hypothetical protein ATL39_0410 [Sinobaca qinghaiensis]